MIRAMSNNPAPPESEFLESHECWNLLRGVSVGTRRHGKICANRDYWDGKKFAIG